MSPYAMPLWTLFTKWPAPLGPQRSEPCSAGVGGPSRSSVRGGCLHARREGLEERGQPLWRYLESASSRSFVTVLQLRAVGTTPSFGPLRTSASFDLPMPFGNRP